MRSKRLYRSSQSNIASIPADEWNVCTYGFDLTGWKFTNGDGMVFYHSGSGIHVGSSNGFSSGVTGEVK